MTDEVAAQGLPVELVHPLGRLYQAYLNRDIQHHGGVAEHGVHVYDDGAPGVDGHEGCGQVGGHCRLADAALGPEDGDDHPRASRAGDGFAGGEGPPALLLGKGGLHRLDHVIRLERFREVVAGPGHHRPAR